MNTSRLVLIFKPTIWCVSTILALALLGFVINAVGVWSFGGVHRWVRWFQVHRAYFLLWRLLIYAVTVYAWLPMRRRVLRTEPDRATAIRLVRAEVAAIVSVFLIEAVQLFQGP